MDYYLHRSDVTFDFAQNNSIEIHNNIAEPWRVTIVDTGLHTMTGGRIKRIRNYIGKRNVYAYLWRRGQRHRYPCLGNLHRGHGKLATITAIQPAAALECLALTIDPT
jgi:glucose-1-phosphate cytidylyltransferase